MLKLVITLTTIMTLLLSTATSLAQTGEKVSEKTLDYTEQMHAALDCAFTGQALEKCSPQLLATDFTSDLDEYSKQVIEIQNQYQEIIDKYESSD